MQEILKGVLVLSVGLFNLILILAVLTKNPNKTTNKSFAVICTSFLIWCITLFLYQYPLFLNSLFWIQMVYMAAVMYMSSTLYFSFVFPSIRFEKAWTISKIYTFFYILFSVWLLFFTKWWVVGVVNDPMRGLQTILHTQGYIVWIAATWVNFLWITVNFILKSKSATGYQKLQLSYLWVGYILFGIAVTVSDGIIPLVWHDTSYFYLSALTNLFFSGLVGYIILKHRFMDIRFLIARSVSYTLLVLILGITYIAGLLIISSWFINFEASYENLFVLTVMSLIMAYSFHPLRTRLEKITDKFFFKEKYNTEELLNTLSKAMATTITVDELSDKILEILARNLRLTDAYLVMKDKDDNQIIIGHEQTLHEEFADSELSMIPQKEMLILDEIEEGALKNMMTDRNIRLIVPLSVKEHFIGFLILGEKSSGEIFFSDDINFLTIFGPELSVALQNAQRFEEISKFNTTLQDEVKSATGELQEANMKLTRLDKMKDEFISIASHDLRSPLASAKNYIWLAASELTKNPKKAKSDLKIALESAEHGIKLVADMLDVSRIEAGRIELSPEKLNLKTVADSILDELSGQALERGVKLSANITSELNIKADKERIHQVFTNLVGNAIKFTSAKGDVNIFAEKSGNFAQITVSDTGVGIKKEDIGKLFTKFGKLENGEGVPSTPGTGLGLYICKNIITLSGGDIHVESTYGTGSKFIFTLPLV